MGRVEPVAVPRHQIPAAFPRSASKVLILDVRSGSAAARSRDLARAARGAGARQPVTLNKTRVPEFQAARAHVYRFAPNPPLFEFTVTAKEAKALARKEANNVKAGSGSVPDLRRFDEAVSGVPPSRQQDTHLLPVRDAGRDVVLEARE